MNSGCRTTLLRLALVATAGLLALGMVVVGQSATAGAASIGQLNSQLSHEQSRQQGLSASVGQLSQSIGTLGGQISLVQSREAAVRTELERDQAALARVRIQRAHERQLVTVLKARLARARIILARQLVSAYENDRPDLMSVVLEAKGFTDLLENIDFLRRAQQQQTSIITETRQAKARADAAQRRLAKLEASNLEITQAVAARANALAGMNTLLQSKQSALQSARAAQQAALAASQAKGRQLQSAIAKLRA